MFSIMASACSGAPSAPAITAAVTLPHTVTATLSIPQANVTGIGFSITPAPTLPLMLTAGQSTSVNVQFTPAAVGSASGSVSFVSTASNSPTSLSLSGTGTTGVHMSWDASTQPVGVTVVGYNVFRGTATGGPYTLLNTSLVLQTSYIDTTTTSGTTYFYVVTAVDPDGIQSIFSSQLTVKAP
jgi:hypothetical protein